MSKISLILRVTLIVLMAISGVFILIFYFGSAVEGTEGTEFYEPTITEGMIKWTYVLFFVAVATAIGFPIVQLIKNPQAAKKTLISVLVLAGVGVIAYLLADDAVLTIPGYNGGDNVPETLKWAGTGLITVYLLLGAALVSIIGSEVSKLFKK